MRWAGHVARMGRRGICRVLVGKAEGKRPLGRYKRRWEDNIKMDRSWYGGGRRGLDCSGSGYEQVVAFVTMVLNLWVP